MKLETIYTNRDDGLSVICILIIHFIFQFSTTSKSKILWTLPSPNFYTLKTFEKSSKYSQNIIESRIWVIFDRMKSRLDI